MCCLLHQWKENKIRSCFPWFPLPLSPHCNLMALVYMGLAKYSIHFSEMLRVHVSDGERNSEVRSAMLKFTEYYPKLWDVWVHSRVKIIRMIVIKNVQTCCKKQRMAKFKRLMFISQHIKTELLQLHSITELYRSITIPDPVSLLAWPYASLIYWPSDWSWPLSMNDTTTVRFLQSNLHHPSHSMLSKCSAKSDLGDHLFVLYHVVHQN